jgi:hypothetical protein
MLFQSDLGGGQQPTRNRQQSGIAVAMPAAMHRYRFEDEIKHGHKPASHHAGLLQQRRREQPANQGACCKTCSAL